MDSKNDTDILDKIARVLSDSENWTPQEMEIIAGLVMDSGRKISKEGK